MEYIDGNMMRATTIVARYVQRKIEGNNLIEVGNLISPGINKFEILQGAFIGFDALSKFSVIFPRFCIKLISFPVLLLLPYIVTTIKKL